MRFCDTIEQLFHKRRIEGSVLIKLERAFFVQFIKFNFVGISNTAISYGVYAGLVSLGLQYIAANIIAFAVSALNSFYWNSKFVFAKKKEEKRNAASAMVKTFIVYGLTAALGNVLLFLMVDYAGVSKYIAPLFLLVVTVPLNFILIKFWAFKAVKA